MELVSAPRSKFIKNIPWPEITALVFISIFVYLVHVSRFSYYRDDWYYMYDRLVAGQGIFVEMFRNLRPARGPLYEILFGLFGTNPIPYHILLYCSRLTGGLGSLWLFRILWPQQRSATFFMALLFLIYPGFLWWVQGFEYQPMILSMGLQIFSIVFTLKAIQSDKRVKWVSWMAAALISGWAYLAFVEYAIGMEVFRWLCVYLVVSRSSASTRRQTLIQTMKILAIPILIPAFFLIWRVFLFDNERRAADISLQTGAVLQSPNTLLWWFIHFAQSVLNVTSFAWALPFNGVFSFLRLKDALFAIGCMMVVLAISYITYRLTHTDNEPASSQTWQLEAISLGFLGVCAGVLPIIISNRVVTFERFSHYALPASLAAVTLVVGLVYMMNERRIRLAILSVLIGLATVTHSATAARAKNEEALINQFWHQISWRVPGLRVGTTLVANYAGMDYADGSDIVWGPANFIYHPEAHRQLPFIVPISAIRMEADTPKNILEGAQFRQSHIVVSEFSQDFTNLLVMSMPSENSCVHVLDGNWAELSVQDTALVALAAPRSKIENVITDGDERDLPATIFGVEPPRTWCYYYQKAQLARQQENWDMIMKIRAEAAALDLRPNDQIEWMPFLQAAAIAGDQKQVKQISTLINTEELYKKQACQNLRAMDELSTEIQSFTRELFCNDATN